MAKVYTPVKNYTGVSASVKFVNGVGETSDADLLKWFVDHGYTVEEELEEELVAEQPTEEMAETAPIEEPKPEEAKSEEAKPPVKRKPAKKVAEASE